VPRQTATGGADAGPSRPRQTAEGQAEGRGAPPETAESRQRPWLIAVAPTVWFAHFLACYLMGAVWCAKVAGPGGPLGPVSWAVAGFTAAALLLVAWSAREGLRLQRLARSGPPYEGDTPRERSGFLGLSTLLLSALSAVAVFYVGAAAVFIGSCR
jgi:hypothetical protein